MARARFHLTRVTKLHQQLRREKEREVKATITSLEEVRARARAAASEREKTHHREQRSSLIDARDLQLFRRFDALLAATELNLQHSAEILGVELHRKREELVERRREEKKLARLGEKHDERAAREVGRQQDLLVDELALLAYARRRRTRQ